MKYFTPATFTISVLLMAWTAILSIQSLKLHYLAANLELQCKTSPAPPAQSWSWRASLVEASGF